MESSDQAKRVNELEVRVAQLERENAELRSKRAADEVTEAKQLDDDHDKNEDQLTPAQIERYSRQLLIAGGFGVTGQLELLKSSVLIVGAGGIGSTVILYLAASGVGKLTIVDFDEVDISNLHRQIIHSSEDVGMNKAESARKAVERINPSIQVEILKMPLSSSNALPIVSQHDCVVDASDNPLTRYTVNDACVLGNVPLVSGSAIGCEGQLTVYNYKGGPCYRCLYPKQSVSEGSKTCSDNGVLGPVPGLVGILQAMETIKLLTGFGHVMSDRLAMYDSLECSFLRIKKPPKQSSCAVCGPNATIKTMDDSYNASSSSRGPSCATAASSPPVPTSNDISCTDYSLLRKNNQPHILLDVRVKEQYELCTLDGAINLPLEELEGKLSYVENLSDGTKPIFCLCRRGIASAMATNMLLEAQQKHPNLHSVMNIKGGLNSWRDSVDSSFPKY
ncbi:unnamed protein product [Cylindrotheca closterium]|uniref:Rhodanese domain-containing protein n=1 Tax=Cylindrotheca closterium TaxID=2856 RepID=A0AAD2PWI7_9STRA|nr:unnamed protein product [Cylindrotheca closterium]